MFLLRVRPLLTSLALACVATAACSADSCAGQKEALQGPQAPVELPTSVPDERPKVVALGDSLTAGLGLVDTQSYPGLLQQKIDAEDLRFEVVNAGVSGDTSAGALRRLEWALQGDVRVLIVALGGNDGLRGLSPSEMKQNLEEIITTARQRGIVVILAGMEAPPNLGEEYATAFRQVFRDLAVRHQVAFIPFLLDRVAGQHGLNQPDGIHPNPAGAAIVADTVWSVLEPVLNQLSTS